jgi:hypothetical protein
MRFAVLILMYDCNQFILRTIENCAPHVEKIFISYSPMPWVSYNTQARSKFSNKTSPEIIDKSKYKYKLEIVQGVWDSEEDQRNAVREMAIQQGFDYLIVQDADEFYSFEDYEINLQGIVNKPDHEVYQVPWVTFWKNPKYVIQHRDIKNIKRTIYSTCPLFAINLSKEIRFDSRRVPLNCTNVFQLKGVCLHFSWIFSDEDVISKISTWGHSHQVNKFWYKYKWLNWSPPKRNISPFTSIEWVKAIPYKGILPKELLDFPEQDQKFIELSYLEIIHSWFIDVGYFLLTSLRIIKRIRFKKLPLCL